MVNGILFLQVFNGIIIIVKTVKCHNHTPTIYLYNIPILHEKRTYNVLTVDEKHT